MKQFIYLDNDIVNSIIAQNEKGLIREKRLEEDNETQKNDNSTISTNIDGGLSGSIFKLVKAETKLNLEAKIGEENNLSNIHREIIEKILHNATFDIAYNYINANNVKFDSEEAIDYGEYVELTRVFDFVDLDYLEGLFARDGLIDFIKKSANEEIKKVASVEMNNMNRQQIQIK